METRNFKAKVLIRKMGITKFAQIKKEKKEKKRRISRKSWGIKKDKSQTLKSHVFDNFHNLWSWQMARQWFRGVESPFSIWESFVVLIFWINTLALKFLVSIHFIATLIFPPTFMKCCLFQLVIIIIIIIIIKILIKIFTK